MSDNGDGSTGIILQTGGEVIQNRPEPRFDVSPAAIKRDIAGNIQLEAIVLSLCNLYARAGGGGFHLSFLLFHFLRP